MFFTRLLRWLPPKMLKHRWRMPVLRRRLPTGRRTHPRCPLCRGSHKSCHHRGTTRRRGCPNALKPPRRGCGHSSPAHEPTAGQRQRRSSRPGRHDDRGCDRRRQLHSFTLDDPDRQTSQALHRVNHKDEATATPWSYVQMVRPRRTCTAIAPQAKQADNGAKHSSYLGIQAR